MSNKLEVTELRTMEYVQSRISSLKLQEAALATKIRRVLPEGAHYVETDAGTILIHIDDSSVTVSYEGLGET